MLNRLPTELTLGIFRQAAEIFVVLDRPSALSLAQTNRLVYLMIVPILLRRVVVTKTNVDAAADLFQRADRAALILDLTVTAASDWSLPRQVLGNLMSIQCIRGYRKNIETVIAALPETALSQLFKIQLWGETMLRHVPPSVTHVCLYADRLADPLLKKPNQWIMTNPSISHFAIELVQYDDGSDDSDATDMADRVATGLDTLLDAGGPRLREVSVRLAGSLSGQKYWDRVLTVFRNMDENRSGSTTQFRLWRDERTITSWETDTKTGRADSRVGVDVWSEARSISTYLS